MINVQCMLTQEWLLTRNIKGLLKCLDGFMNEGLQVLLAKGGIDVTIKAGLFTAVSGSLHWQLEQDWQVAPALQLRLWVVSKRHFVSHFLSPNLSKEALGGGVQPQQHGLIESANSTIRCPTHPRSIHTPASQGKRTWRWERVSLVGGAAFTERGYSLSWVRLRMSFLFSDHLEVMCFPSLIIHEGRRCLQEEGLASHYFITA